MSLSVGARLAAGEVAGLRAGTIESAIERALAGAAIRTLTAATGARPRTSDRRPRARAARR